MESTMQKPALVAAESTKSSTMVCWLVSSAILAHFALGDGPEKWGWAAATGLLWGLSYFFWRRLQAGSERS